MVSAMPLKTNYSEDGVRAGRDAGRSWHPAPPIAGHAASRPEQLARLATPLHLVHAARQVAGVLLVTDLPATNMGADRGYVQTKLCDDPVQRAQDYAYCLLHARRVARGTENANRQNSSLHYLQSCRMRARSEGEIYARLSFGRDWSDTTSSN